MASSFHAVDTNITSDPSADVPAISTPQLFVQGDGDSDGYDDGYDDENTADTCENQRDGDRVIQQDLLVGAHGGTSSSPFPYDPNCLSPSLHAASLHTLPRFLTPPPNMASEASSADGATVTASPFNFQTQFIATSPVKSNIGQRRGHRYKHSSISAQHQVFQEPPPRPPPVVPASLPVPTVKEAWKSMSTDQRRRFYWCLCHAAVAVVVFFSAGNSLAMTALGHLVFFDVGSAALCVTVEVLGNFEVWRRSTLRHPFGLQRVEVLAGFANSIFLMFGGFDLISHNLKHVLEGVGGHEPHHPHSQPEGTEGFDLGLGIGHSHDSAERISAGSVDLATLLAIVSTVISAYGLKNHGRISRVMRVSYMPNMLPAILSNPFHALTLTFSSLMLLLPLLSIPVFVWLDNFICMAIAAAMMVLGFMLGRAQGYMLLMAYRGRSKKSGGKAEGAGEEMEEDSVRSVLRDIEAEPSIVRVDESQFWQVHYGLCMANLKVRVVRGMDDGALSQLRSRVARLVQNRLGEGYGRGGSLRWEVTMQTSSDGVAY